MVRYAIIGESEVKEPLTGQTRIIKEKQVKVGLELNSGT